jgi:hypothetical protein
MKKMSELGERAQRGKRLLIYGMFSLAVVTFVSVLLTVWMFSQVIPGGMAVALKTASIVTAISIVASVIVWFIYTKAILKE